MFLLEMPIRNTIATIEGVDTLLVEAYISRPATGNDCLMKTDSTEILSYRYSNLCCSKASSGNDASSGPSSLLSGMGLGDIPGTTIVPASYLVRISIIQAMTDLCGDDIESQYYSFPVRECFVGSY